MASLIPSALAVLASLSFSAPGLAQTLGNPGPIPTLDGSSLIPQGATATRVRWPRNRRWPTPDSPGLWEIRLNALPTGWIERFLLQIPNPPPTGDVPLLVGFHRFGNTMYDITQNTGLAQEAQDRGWLLLAPLGAADINHASLPSQENTEIVLRTVCDYYPVDVTRIYGVGHSMGGGNCLNYAARHVDPREPMFAALINHTGTLSQRHSYEHDCFTPAACGNQWLWEFWYGGTPTTNEFDFLRSSVIDIPYEPFFPTTPLVDPTTDLARNLTHIPMQTWMAQFDPLSELVLQNNAFAAHMTLRGADHVQVLVPFNNHAWSTLDFTAACDFLAQHTLTLPPSAETLADGNRRYFHFDVVQNSQDQFSPFQWAVDEVLNTCAILGTENIASIGIDTVSANLDTSPGATLTLTLDTSDGLGDVIRISNVTSMPATILRDALPSVSFSYDAVGHELTIQELDGGPHVWGITF